MTIYLCAFVGGILLNFLPCVLPVLFMKVMAAQRKRSWQYVAGVMSVFFTLGVAACGPGFVWGGQFDHWWFTWGTAAVCFLMGLTYLDVWHLPSFGFREAQSDFGKGVLTTILSSACSGPFLGAVFAASLTEPWYQTITLFMLIGAGLVTPYLFFPRKWIPKPGAWMDTLKKLAGVSLIGTAAWLLAGSTAAVVVIIILFWLRTLADGRRRLALSGVYTFLLLALAVFTLWGHSYPVQPYDVDELESLRHRQRVVIVQFTSKYCITCQMNEYTLQSRSVTKVFSDNNVVVMKAMMPDGLQLLKSLGYTSVPVMAVYPGPADPIVLPDVVNTDQIITAVRLCNGILNGN